MPAPERTSLAEIVAAGQRLLESEGLSGLTMQAVAAHVGVRSPSLYKRVRDRDDLVRLVAISTGDDLAERLATAPPTVAGLARAYRAFARERPEGFRLLHSSVLDKASAERNSAPVLAVARQLVGDPPALEAARFITAWATGFIGMELSGAFRLDGDLDSAFEFGIIRLEASLTPPHLASATASLVERTPPEF